jgi:hypothetical protein
MSLANYNRKLIIVIIWNMDITYYILDFSGRISKYQGFTPIFSFKEIVGLEENDNLGGIDRLVTNGKLYGLARNGLTGNLRLYELDAESTPAIASNPVLLIQNGNPITINTDFFFIDFDPVTSRLRIVTRETSDSNISTDINGNAIIDTNITGGAPYGIGYTNNIPLSASSTAYVLGFGEFGNQLFVLEPENSGVLSPVGDLDYVGGVFFGEMDIFTPVPDVNLAFAVIVEDINGVTQLSLYSISLGDDPVATFLGKIPYDGEPTGLSGFAIISTQVPCLHPQTGVRTPRSKGIKIEKLRAGDEVVTHTGEIVKIVNNIRFGNSKDFYCIKKNAMGKNQPCRDVLIREGHPVLYRGEELDAKKLRKKLGLEKVVKTMIDTESPVWSLSTRERVFVMMDNIPVSTWADKDLLKSHYHYTRF